VLLPKKEEIDVMYEKLITTDSRPAPTPIAATMVWPRLSGCSADPNEIPSVIIVSRAEMSDLNAHLNSRLGNVLRHPDN